MKNVQFLIFFAIVLTIYGLVNFYIFIRGWQALPAGSSLRIYYLPLFLTLALSYIAGRFLERAWPSLVSEALVWIGSYWLAAMLYFFLILLLVDIVRLINLLLPVIPAVITDHDRQAKLIAVGVAIGIVAVTLLAGHFNAVHPRIRMLDLSVPKAAGRLKTVNIVLVSDIHLGTTVNRARFDRIVAKINELKPDLVLLAGDVVDEDLAPVVRENQGEAMRSITAPLGVFAITGNHEYYGGVEAACAYLQDHGVTMLRDTVVMIAESFYLVGREDREAVRLTRRGRMSLEELMASVDRRYPVILLDHQPFHLDQAAANGVDIQFSGHTHHGQLWPLNFITDAVYEVSTGYKRIGETQVYVSTGAGTWGPPVRTGNRPEIVNIRLSFQ